jgi:hypothetical protein
VKILGLRLKMMKIQFGPSICENYSLVPKLWKITDWSLEHISRYWWCRRPYLQFMEF